MEDSVEDGTEGGYTAYPAEMVLSLWTIYDHPTDVPEPFGFAVREWHVTTDSGAVADSRVQLAMTLEEARALVPAGLYRLPRDPNDDAKIVETWL